MDSFHVSFFVLRSYIYRLTILYRFAFSQGIARREAPIDDVGLELVRSFSLSEVLNSESEDRSLMHDYRVKSGSRSGTELLGPLQGCDELLTTNERRATNK